MNSTEIQVRPSGSAIQYSSYQEKIFSHIRNPRAGSAIIQAVAGSGKTTTIVKALEFIPSNQSVTFLAFNRSIVQELKARVPKHVFAMTFHSTSFRAYKRWFGGDVEVIDNKVQQIIKKMLTDPSVPKEHFQQYRGFVNKLVGFAKGAGMGALISDTDESWAAIVDHHDMTLDSHDAKLSVAIGYAQQTLRRNNQALDVIDQDDMLYLTLINNVGFYKCDWVFVDEAQDLNGVQIALLRRMLKANGRMVAVGDESQAIYGWRGANSDAMQILAREFKCTPLPLTVSYRCPKKVVLEAQKYCGAIQSAPTAPEGSVDFPDDYGTEDFKPTDAILCRNSAPLVAMAYELLSRNVGCRILGREIGQGLIDLIDRMDASTIQELSDHLQEYRSRECAELLAKDKEAAAAAIADKVECILLLAGQLSEDHRTVDGLKERIDSLFSDEKGVQVLTLSTVHKSKGMEWERVSILDFEELMPSRYAKKDWQRVQECNLMYVAVTRAKNTLRFINSNSWRKQISATVSASTTVVTTKGDVPVSTLVGGDQVLGGDGELHTIAGELVIVDAKSLPLVAADIINPAGISRAELGSALDHLQNQIDAIRAKYLDAVTN
jgi:DNA helicase-2/ATP-dependent DNA helicase PcrA